MTNNNNKTWKLDDNKQKDNSILIDVINSSSNNKEDESNADKDKSESSSPNIDSSGNYNMDNSSQILQTTPEDDTQIEFRLNDLRHSDGLKLNSNASLDDRLKLLNRVGKPQWQIVTEYDIVVTDKDTFFIGANTIVKTELVISLLFNRLLGGVKQKIGIVDNLPFNNEELFFDFINSALDNNSNLKFISEQLTEALRNIIIKIDIIPLLIYEEFKINASKKAYPMSDGVYLFNDETEKLNEDDLKQYESLRSTFNSLRDEEDGTETRKVKDNEDRSDDDSDYDNNKVDKVEDNDDENSHKIETFREV